MAEAVAADAVAAEAAAAKADATAKATATANQPTIFTPKRVFVPLYPLPPRKVQRYLFYAHTHVENVPSSCGFLPASLKNFDEKGEF